MPAKRGPCGRLAGECHRDASADQDDEEDPSPRPRRQAAGADIVAGQHHPVLLALGASLRAPEVRRRVGVAEGLQVAANPVNNPRHRVDPSLLRKGLGGGIRLLLLGHHKTVPPGIENPISHHRYAPCVPFMRKPVCLVQFQY